MKMFENVVKELSDRARKKGLEVQEENEEYKILMNAKRLGLFLYKTVGIDQ
jgi:hypothetical protein